MYGCIFLLVPAVSFVAPLVVVVLASPVFVTLAALVFVVLASLVVVALAPLVLVVLASLVVAVLAPPVFAADEPPVAVAWAIASELYTLFVTAVPDPGFMERLPVSEVLFVSKNELLVVLFVPCVCAIVCV